jgi:hypothetical protein
MANAMATVTTRTHRIILDPVDGLPSEPYAVCDLANTCGIAEHRLRTLELPSAVAWAFGPCRRALHHWLVRNASAGVRNASALRFLRGLGLRLSRRGHERD